MSGSGAIISPPGLNTRAMNSQVVTANVGNGPGWRTDPNPAVTATVTALLSDVAARRASTAMSDMYRIWCESAPGSRAWMASQLSCGTPLQYLGRETRSGASVWGQEPDRATDPLCDGRQSPNGSTCRSESTPLVESAALTSTCGEAYYWPPRPDGGGVARPRGRRSGSPGLRVSPCACIQANNWSMNRSLVFRVTFIPKP